MAGVNSEKERIQGTNDSSIVSNYSTEQIYASDGHSSYFTPFVGIDRVRRRSPLINRGSWLLMRCVEHVVQSFLTECSPGAKKVVVNLGCGYDPLPFEFLSQGFQDNILYVDIDYPAVISIKAQKVASDPQLTPLLHNIQQETGPAHQPQVRIRSDEYLAIGCNLEQLDWLNALFEKEGILDCEILFTAEVSVTYMRTEAANALIKWAGSLPNAKFSFLEQLIPDGPDHPFARTMLKHFESLKTPLQSVRAYPTLQSQVKRFMAYGWENVHASDLLGFWANKMNNSEKDHPWRCEEFDEWEEFYLFAQHYCLLLAQNHGTDNDPNTLFFKSVATNISKGGESCSSWQLCSDGLVEELVPLVYASSGDFHAKVIPTPSKKFLSRFGAAEALNESAIMHYGGLTVAGRTNEHIVISSTSLFAQKPYGDHSPKARMCHTLTKIDENIHLLFGGRTAPTNVLGDTWLYGSGKWKQWQYPGEQWRLFASGPVFPRPRSRHCAVANKSRKEVLVFGGIGEGNEVLGDWHVFNLEKQTWSQVIVTNAQGSNERTPPPRFAASMCTIADGVAIMTGGIDGDQNVLHDMWKVMWNETEVIVEQITLHPQVKRLLWRFGAQLVKISDMELLLIGGVSGGSLMRTPETIVTIDVSNDIRVTGTYAISIELSPLLVGFTAGLIRGTLVLAGGGAVCFGFGAEWNTNVLAVSRNANQLEALLSQATREVDGLITESPAIFERKFEGCQTTYGTPSLNGILKSLSHCRDILRVRINSGEDFAALIANGEPAILEGIRFGTCVEKWNWEYLKKRVGEDRQIIVHSSTTSQMSFTTKNFTYEKTTFGAFINAISSAPSSASQPGLYLRSISASSPAKQPANLEIDFPELACDFNLPSELKFVQDNLHSSPLRISSADVGMWLHFDVTANVLFHVVGAKRFRLWHPHRALELGFPPGGSSSATILNPFSDLSITATTTASERAKFVPPDYDILLHPGDAIFIPPVFPHAALPVTPCVAVNVFFRDLDRERYAPGKDVYGNRDLVAYERGRQVLGKIVREFEGLPEWVRRFYLERLGAEVIEKAREGWNSG
ncbi:LCM-domain-containing protein [Terfezia boudieri ATCC MYA-4762]|uniref:tRNA wybutosine-synthesizing protein 4 n=1 Tax=Terfezia boudieri ATCC MYA-4762 TaxID=1051890 RepID=A0A3N4LDL3_9PEZI|nr:LCM-domain-containing protein [Terfezia boudieri ATCC MYA-4762]